MRKYIILIIVVSIFIFFSSLNFVSALSIKTVTPNVINRSAYTIINFTLNNTDTVNITKITITLPMEAIYSSGSNGTNSISSSFSSSIDGPNTQLIWINTTAGGIMPNALTNETRSFWFNATIRNLMNSFFTNITVRADYISGSPYITGYNYIVYFSFSGFIRNETGGNVSNVNLTIYQWRAGQNGPPTEAPEASAISDTAGSFSFAAINGSASLYSFKIYGYGPAQGCLFANDSCNATRTGQILPPFPAPMYYPTTVDNPMFEFMRPPSLNGTTFYLQPAATLRLYANNGTSLTNAVPQKFGYQVVDKTTGFPVASNVMASVSTADIVVPVDRSFSVMFSRFPSASGGFGFYPACNGAFMNDSACPSPPVSNSSLGTLTAGQILVLNQSLSISNYRLTGCIKTNSINNSAINITTISLKMVPWPGFVPPTRADMGNINITSDISYNLTLYSKCNATDPTGFAFYNISVMGAASGLNYMLEIYAKNATNEIGNPSSANNLAVFQNISITTNKEFNLTMQKLVGSYLTGDLNTSKFRVRIQNSTGGAITTNLNANVKIKNPAFGTMTYMIESMSSGVFDLTILNNSNWAKVMVFANDAPPKEITLNLSLAEQNITLVTMSDGMGVGMKKINASGQMEMINSTNLNSTMPITLRFLRNSAACNVLTPDSSCQLTSVQAKNFNPLTAMVAGKINMEMKITSTNVTMTFMNFDMFSAKQPPMDSIFNDQASSGGNSNSQVWQFGSFAPSNTYEYVIITMPYSDSAIDDSSDINLKTPLLYDENWNVIWNQSRGDTSANLSDDFIDYNSTSLYVNYLSSGGITCSKTDSNLNVTPCYVNITSNMISMRIPHFSGVGPGVTGTAPSSATSPTTSSSPGGSTNAATYTFTESEFKTGSSRLLRVNDIIKFNIVNNSHSLKLDSYDYNNKKVTITISSTPQIITLAKGENKKLDVNSDNKYDVEVSVTDMTVGYVRIKVQQASGDVPASEAPASTTSTETGKETTTSEITKSAWPWILVVIVIIIIVLIYNLYKKKKYYKKGF